MVNISDTRLPRQKVIGGYLGLLLIDLQERLAPAIPESPSVINRAARLIDAAERASLPVLATEQYPKGLGPTVAKLRGKLQAGCIIEKTAFAAPREQVFRDAAAERGVEEFAVAGTEAHVCVLQTVLCLLDQGYRVTLVGDAVASRASLNREVAVRRMAAAGASVTGTEQVIARFGAAVVPEGIGRSR